MTGDLSLDPAVVDAQLGEVVIPAPQTPWHARRLYGFGASDVPALLVGLGKRDASTVTKHVVANARTVRIAGIEVPRIVAEKAGRKASLKAGNAARVGTARERELMMAWAATLGPGDALDPESFVHASAMPIEFLPLVDRECPRLAVSPDGWCRDWLGELVLLEAKCAHVWRDALPWYWRAQVMAQLAATARELGVLVCGQGWARSMTATGRIDAWPIERDEHEIEEIRDAVRVGWQMVEQIREAA